MRGTQNFQGAMFSYIGLEDRVPAKHPLRKLSAMIDSLLATMSAEFETVYPRSSCPSLPTEKLRRQQVKNSVCATCFTSSWATAMCDRLMPKRTLPKPRR